MTQERPVAASAEADQADERAQAARQTPVDLLLVIKPAAEKDQALLIIVNGRLGARLRMERISTTDPQIAADDAARAVKECQKNYADGVKYVIGIPNFLNDSLTRTHDGLQREFASMLQGAMLSRPGVAVLELGEIEAIAPEVALGAGSGERTVRQFIGGKFRVGSDGSVELTISRHMADGSNNEISRRFAAVEQCSRWLCTDAADLLLEGEQSGTLSVDEQFELLAARADECSQMGFWADSVDLRLTALLLKPDDLTQRKAVVLEPGRIAQLLYTGNADVAPSLVRTQLAAWRSFEYLVRNRLVSAGGAIALLTHPARAQLLADRVPLPALQELEQARREHIENVLPLILDLDAVDLDGKPVARQRLVRDWFNTFLCQVAGGAHPAYITREELDFRYRILTSKTPADAPVLYGHLLFDEGATRRRSGS